MATVIRALFGQGPRVSHRWWETLQHCRNLHYKSYKFPEYVAMLFTAGAAEFNLNPAPGALIGEFKGVVSSRTKSLPNASLVIPVDNYEDVCQTLAITSDDFVAILVGIGYNVVCLEKRGLAA